jgi:hypothetical protein
MITIKNSEELVKLVDGNKDLHLEDQDVRIEFQFTRDELRNVYCNDLFLMNDKERFDFNGGDFNGRDFNGRDFNGRDFNGRDFNGWDFNGWDFNGRNFNGKKVLYYAFFNCYGHIKCESIKGRRTPHAEPICLDGKLEIKEDNVALEAIKLLEEKGYKIIKN